MSSEVGVAFFFLSYLRDLRILEYVIFVFFVFIKKNFVHDKGRLHMVNQSI